MNLTTLDEFFGRLTHLDDRGCQGESLAENAVSSLQHAIHDA